MSLYRPVNIGNLQLEGNLFLAPVAGYTDRAFRSLCVEQGANFSFTELISAEALCRSSERYGLNNTAEALSAAVTGDFPAKTFEASGSVAAAANLVRRGNNETRYAIQLFGSEPESIYKAAVILAPLRPSAIDINAGCPVPKVVKNGAGSALMKTPTILGKIIEAAVRASGESLGGAPVTIKMRSGWESQFLNYAECA